MAEFFSRLTYTLGNEDWLVEKRALQIKPTDRVLCITASGDRPLHSVIDGCQEVIAIDANPTQNYLLELKRQALKQLNFDEYLSFLGIKACNNRLTHLENLLKNMEASSANYWSKNKSMIKKGVIYQGFFEKWLRAASCFLRFFRKKKIDGLFATKTLEEQKIFIKTKWDTYLWRKLIDVALKPSLMKLTLKDPSLYAFDQKSKLSDVFYRRFHHCLESHLLKDNFFISFLFKGYIPEDSCPPYLTKEGCAKIKPNLDKIKWVTRDILSYLRSSPDNSIDCYSLSDVASYISQTHFEQLMTEIQRTAKMGARFSIRQVLSDHKIPSHLRPFFRRDHDLESNLEKDDRCFIYRFMVGTISK